MGLVFIENDLFWVYDKKTGFGRLKWAAVVGCPMGFDMYVYIHIASGIYLQTYVMCPGLNLSCRLNLFCLCVSQYLVDFTVIFGFVIFVITVIGLLKKNSNLS